MRWCLLCCVAAFGALVPSASAKTVRYRGRAARVPDSWRVIDLAASPSTCVRLDRPVVYLGRPRRDQVCPAHAIGRRQAIVLGSPSGRTARAPRARAHAASAVFTGKGFDTCSTPSESKMAAWSASPYRAIGVYIGGANMACAQPNLTASWVSTETAAGWHLVLTYVGLQGAGSCGGSCATINPKKAAAQGKAAADDAVTQALVLGIPAGNPIYDDMEAYTQGGSNTSTVLKFLSAWTGELHAQGYLSGVYSSGASGIADLVGAAGRSGFHEPDEIWVADWNGKATTSDPYLPTSMWRNHQRIHQYTGARNEKYGGVKLNIDNDYLDASTADTHGSSQPPAKPPSPCVVPRLRHDTLPQARRALKRAGCRLGKVRRPRHPHSHHRLHVVSQSPQGGKHEAAGYSVRVTLR